MGAMAAAIDQAVRKLMTIEHIRRRITLRIQAGNSVQKVGEARPVKSTDGGAWLLKLILMVSADCEPTSASCIRRSSEKPTMDCDHSKLNGAAFGTHDWLNYLRDQAATYRKLVERAVDPFVKTELRALASVCEEIADNIEDHLTGGEDHAPRGPSSKLS